MKYICTKEVKLEKDYLIQNNEEEYKFINWDKFVCIKPGIYKAQYEGYEHVTLNNVHIHVDGKEDKIFTAMKFNKNALVDNGHFEGNLIEKLFYKKSLEYLNRKDLYWENKEKRKTINAAKKILSEASQEVLKELPIWMKCNIILKDLRDHFIETNEDLDENQLNWINKILKHPCKNHNEFDFNIFDEIHSLDELKELQDASNAAEYDIGPKRKEICKRCGNAFYLTKGELDWYFCRDLNVPKKCPYCRKGIERPVMIYPENKNFYESIEEEPVKTEMQIALEKAGITVTEQK